MVAKVPIRTVYTGSSATGLSEFQSGEFIDYVVGGTGLVALGTAGQVLATNSGATAMEWVAAEIGDITKKVLKKLYKDLSYHHPYIIDRIKV